MATGLLIVSLGEGTKLTEILMDAGKIYLATVRLGQATETDDRARHPTTIRSGRPV